MDHESAKTGNKPSTVTHKDRPNARQFMFAQFRAKGLTQVEAYRRIYNPRAKEAHAKTAACKIEALPAVRTEIDRLRALASAKSLLSVNDRYGILAAIAQSPEARDEAKVLAIREYNKMEPGALAPERQEISGPGGAPLASTATVIVGQMTRREKVAAWREARRAARAAQAQPTGPA